MRSPAVSIILPTFDRLEYLPDAVESVLAQTFEDWELLIADDGSAAPTRAYLRTVAHPPRVRVLCLEHTGRPARVRNAALREAKGEYVAFMDSDDVWRPDKLAVQIASLRARGGCGWSHTNFLLLGAAGRPAREMRAAAGWILGPLLRTETVIALPSVVAVRALLDEVGGFDEELVMCEDYDLWLRLAARSAVVAIDAPLTVVRRHTQHYGNPAVSFRDSLRVLDKVMHTAAATPYASVIRRERAKNCASLARCHAASGDRRAAWRTLLSTAPASWGHAGWWSEALKAVTVVLAPRGLRSIVHRHRRRSA